MNFSLPTKHNVLYMIDASEATEQYINAVVYQISYTRGINCQIINTVLNISVMRCICLHTQGSEWRVLRQIWYISGFHMESSPTAIANWLIHGTRCSLLYPLNTSNVFSNYNNDFEPNNYCKQKSCLIWLKEETTHNTSYKKTIWDN